MKLRRISAIASLTLLLLGGIYLGVPSIRAQVSQIVGFVQTTNYLAPTSGQMAAVGGVVTNPASNFIIQVSAGTAYCYNGAALEVPPVQMTLLASNTYIVVFNCSTQTVYAKQAVIGPGSVTGQPGVPNTVLQASAGVEIPIATVVCGSTNCGNTSNGTITDVRVPGQWLIGTPTGAHLNTPTTASARGDISGICTLGTNCAITFAIPYQVAPACVATDTTSAAATKAVTSGGPPVTTLTITGTSTDVIAYVCVGDPN